MIDYDVAVAGAGPAGSVFALLAARAGYRVLLAERSSFEKPRFGETAPPELRAALTRIGLDHLARAPCARRARTPCPGSRSVTVAQSYRLTLWCRTASRSAKIDQALASAARDAGADLRPRCGVKFARHADNGHLVQLQGHTKWHQSPCSRRGQEDIWVCPIPGLPR